MQVFTSVLVLGLCFAAFVISHIRDYKERKAEEMVGVAQLIATNSTPAILFQDNDNAKRSLLDLRKVAPEVINASILDSTGKVFATYRKPLEDTFSFHQPSLKQKEFEFSDRKLIVIAISLTTMM
jgi:hypothetical protein